MTVRQEIHPQDYEAVRELMAEAQQLYENEHCQEAAAVWMRAYSLFKKKERAAGLPESHEEKLVYGAIVANLKASGKLLLAWAETSGVDLTVKGFSRGDLAASIKMLSLDDNAVEFEPSEGERETLDQLFGKV